MMIARSRRRAAVARRAVNSKIYMSDNPSTESLLLLAPCKMCTVFIALLRAWRRSSWMCESLASNCLFLEDCPLNSFLGLYHRIKSSEVLCCAVCSRKRPHDARVNVFQGTCITLWNSVFLEFHFTVDLLFRIWLRQLIIVQILSA